MKKILLPLFVLFIFSCGEELRPLSKIVRINEKTQDLELAFKEYINKSSGVKVFLLPMVHIAKKSFYDLVNERITDKIVLYESFGESAEQSKYLKNRINNLGLADKNRIKMLEKFYYTYNYYAEAFGLEKQLDYINYELAKEAIHADYLDSNVEIILKKNDRDLEIFYTELIGKLFIAKNMFGPMDDLIKEYDKTLRSQVKDIREFLGLNKHKIDSNINLEDNKNLLLTRDLILKEKIKETINRKPPPKEIFIVYGYLHMVSVEKYLEELGFTLVENSVEWITAFNINKQKV